MYRASRNISVTELQKGDLFFFANSKGEVGHVMLIHDQNNIVESSTAFGTNSTRIIGIEYTFGFPLPRKIFLRFPFLFNFFFFNF
jgi:cell wall-associated NlpC family hydrolase